MRAAPARRIDPKAEPMPPDQVLTPRTLRWPPTAITGTLLTAGCAAWVNLTGDLDPLAVCAAGGSGTAAATYVAARSDLRRRKVDKIREQLAAELGYRRPTRSKVRTYRWSLSWHSTPQKVVIRYARPVRDVIPDPKWKPTIVDTVSRVLGANYVVADHSWLKSKLVLERSTAVVEQTDPMADRAQRLVASLLGESASLTSTQCADDGSLFAVEIHKPVDAKLAHSGNQHRIEQTWSKMMPGRWRARFDLENDQIRLEVRPTFPELIWAAPPAVDPDVDMLKNYDDVAIPYAKDEDGNDIVWRPAHRSNFMLVGRPGSGKTSTDHTLVEYIAGLGWPVLIVDGKRTSFLGYRDWPNVQVVATSIEEQVAVLHRACALMEYRYDLIVQGKASSADFEPTLVVIDEWAEFRGNLMGWYRSRKITGFSEPPVVDMVRSMARMGRESRVHLLLATQRPDAEFFGKDMRDNFEELLSLGSLSPQGAYMMWQSTSTGVSVPRHCRGRATGVNQDGRPVEVQAFYAPDPAKVAAGSSEAELLERMRPKESRHPRLVMVPPEPVFDEKAKREVVTYDAVAEAEWALASERPDLDPLAASSDAEDPKRDVASPMAVFGPGGRSEAVGSASTGRKSSKDYDWEAEEYEEPLEVSIREVEAGDLVLVDADADQWATAEQDAEPDLVDGSEWCLSWRSADDEEGTLQMGENEIVTVRRPLEAGEGGAAA